MSDFFTFQLTEHNRPDIESACRVAFETEHGYGNPEANIDRYRVFRDGFYACALRGDECSALASVQRGK